MAANEHKKQHLDADENPSDANLHEPLGFATTATINDIAVKDELGNLLWEKRQVLVAVLDHVDNTAVPPTENDGDIYLLDNTGASNAEWDGASANSWVRYKASTDLWSEITALDGYIVYDKTADKLKTFNGTAWAAGSGLDGIYGGSGSLSGNTTVTMGGSALILSGGNLRVTNLTASQFVKTDASKNLVSSTISASDVSDFDAEVSNNASVTANTAKVTNATHTGDVTGSTVLTIASKAVEISMLADGTDGELITWDASGVATTVAVGTAGQVLTSNGIGTAPTFQAGGGGGGIYGGNGTVPTTTATTITDTWVITGGTVTIEGLVVQGIANPSNALEIKSDDGTLVGNWSVSDTDGITFAMTSPTTAARVDLRTQSGAIHSEIKSAGTNSQSIFKASRSDGTVITDLITGGSGNAFQTWYRSGGQKGVEILPFAGLGGTITIYNSVGSTQAVRMFGTGTSFFNGGNVGFGLSSGITEQVHVSGNVRVSGNYKVGANQVVGAQITGWTDQTATGSKSDLGASPTVGALSSFCRSLYDDLKTHGLIAN